MEQSRTVDDFLKAERKGRDCVYRLGITCTQSDSLPSRGSVVKWTISSRVTTMLPLPNKTTRSDVSSCMLPSCSPTFCPSTAVEISRYNLLRHSHQQNSPVAASFHSVSLYLVPTKRMRTCVKLLLVLNSYFGQSYFVSHRTAVFLVRSTRTERKRKVDEVDRRFVKIFKIFSVSLVRKDGDFQLDRSSSMHLHVGRERAFIPLQAGSQG